MQQLSYFNTNKKFFKTDLSGRNKRLSNHSRKIGSFLNSENVITLAISASIAFPIVETLINVFLNVEFWDSFIMYGIFYSVLLLSTYYSLHRFRNRMIGIPSLFIAIWVCSYCYFPENRAFLTKEIFLPLMTLGIPLFVSVMGVRDVGKLYKALRIASIASIIAGIAFFLLQLNGKYEISYMSFSYTIILPVMLMWIYSFQNKKKIDISVAFVGTAIVFLTGARGPLVGLISGIIFYFLVNFKFTVKNIILLFISSLFILYLVINFNNLLQYLNDFLQKKNMSSRTVSLLLNDKIEQLSGRDEIYDQALSLSRDLFIGKGMGGDRVALGGTYAHNFFLEIILEYGIILGSFFIICLLFYLLRALFIKHKGEFYYFFMAIFFTTGFVTLQFSFSYTLEPTFFIMLALAIRLTKQRKIKKKYDQTIIS